jgi:hypothetical protein
MRTITTAILILLLANHPARAGVPRTVAVGIDTSTLSPKIATEIQDGVADRVLYGLGEVFSNTARTRIQLVPITDAKVEGQIRDCDSDACLQDIAQSGIADLVVQVKVQVKKAAKKGKSDYGVFLIVARAYPEREAWRDQSDCKKCGIPEIKLMSSLVAGDIADRIKIDFQPPKATPPKAAPAPTPLPPVAAVRPAVPPPRATIVSPPSHAKPQEEAWSVPRYVSGSVLGAGLVLVGVGGYLLHINGRGTCDLAAAQWQCQQVRTTSGVGTAMVIGGSIVAAGGLAGMFLLAPSSGDSRSAKGFDGFSISLRGTY